MNRQFVCETTFAGLRPLGIGGRRIQESWHEIDAALRTNLGDAYARLFAEPVAAEGATSWFAEPEGEPVVYSRLDDAAKRRLIAVVQERLAAIHAKVAELEAAADPAKRRLGEALGRALSVPGPLAQREFLYAIRPAQEGDGPGAAADEPVLVNWGTRDDVPDPPLAALEDFLRGEALRLHPVPPQPASEFEEPAAADQPVAAEPSPAAAADSATPEAAEPAAGPAVEPPELDPAARVAAAPDREEPAEQSWQVDTVPPTAPRAASWPWWLLFAVLLTAIIVALLPTCGVLVPFLSACRVTDDDLEALRARGRELEQQMRMLQHQAAILAPCEVPKPEQQALAPVAPPPPLPAPAVVPSAPIPVVPASQPERIERLDRAVVDAGGEVSDVVVTLQWQTAGDLDLRVYCPNGSLIDFQLKGQPQPLCGRGRLDVDANVDDAEISASPIENVSWPARPPNGTYQVEVHNFKSRPPSTGAVAFTLRIRKGGLDQLIEGTVLPGERRHMYEFTIP
jgi:hypothetical protein